VTSVRELKAVSARIRAAALAAADPRRAVREHLSLDGKGIAVSGEQIPAAGRLVLAAVGKASPAMAEAALEVFGERVDQGIIVMPRGYACDLPSRFPRVKLFASGHPIPDEEGLRAAAQLMEVVRGMSESDVCLLLLSGGGSALLPLPQPPVSLADKQEVTALLLACGAEIREINTVRKHLSAIKGGRLAEACRGRILTLAVSDVVGDSLPSIASGPTTPDPTTFGETREILDRYSLLPRLPATVRSLIGDGVAGRVPDTPKALPERHTARVIAGNRGALQAAAAEAEACGYPPLLLTAFLSGEAREAGRLLAAVAREVCVSRQPAAPPACVIAGGETTVTLRGGGRGGRNQEIALSAALELAGLPGVLLTSFATDGKEGNTEAAGATASGETAAAGRKAGADPLRCLRENDSHAFLEAAGELVVTGPTYTNVNDLSFLLIAERGPGMYPASRRTR
jgi:glycerate 2-kinase